MLQEISAKFFYDYSYLQLFVFNTLYFFFLYFGLGYLFNKVCKFLEVRNILNQINTKEVTSRQINFEIKQSLKSIFIFGFSVVPLAYLIRCDYIILLPDSLLSILYGLCLLTIWNEVHFFVIHRTLHFPFFMKNIHFIHHQSVVPTTYSVYSFHWVEAILLSSVSITLVPFIPVSGISIALYPLVSILFNFSGHCNYRFGNGSGKSWKLFGTNHNQHHSKGMKKYGFILTLLDEILEKYKK